MKAAVLDRDPDVPNLVAVSYYDQEPVHFLSTTCESIHWIQCQKQVYCSETQRLQSQHGWRRHCRSTPKLLQFQPLDEEKEVVVVNIFLGICGASCQCICFLQNIHDFKRQMANVSL